MDAGTSRSGAPIRRILCAAGAVAQRPVDEEYRLPARPAYTTKEVRVITLPEGMNPFAFAVVSSLRAAQLQRGCTPRVERGANVAITAQHEVAERKVQAALDEE